MTYTLVKLEVPAEFHDFVAEKLREAEYDHAFVEGGGLDMTHIALVKPERSDALKRKYGKIDPEWAEIFAKDGLDHEVEMVDDVLRWKPDPLVRWMVDQMDLNDFWHPRKRPAMHDRPPISKNDPRVREMYRKMGYSISGYWEIFFWDMNNELAEIWEGGA